MFMGYENDEGSQVGSSLWGVGRRREALLGRTGVEVKRVLASQEEV